MRKTLRAFDLNLLTVFDAIMRAGQLSGAGDALGMTQPAVSNALSRLRHSFQDELFIRSRHGMTATPRAHELIGPVREALSIIQNAVEPSVQFDPANSQRRFTIAMSDFGELTLMPQLLKTLSQQSSAIAIECVQDLTSANYDLLRQGQLDLAIGYLPPAQAQLDWIKLGESEAVVIVADKHPRIKASLTLDHYLAERHIILSHKHSRQTVLEQLLEGQALPRKVLAEVGQYTAVAEMVTHTEAIAVMSKDMAQYYAALLPIKLMPFPIAMNKISAYLIWNKALDNDKGHRWLRDIIISFVADEFNSTKQPDNNRR